MLSSGSTVELGEAGFLFSDGTVLNGESSFVGIIFTVLISSEIRSGLCTPSTNKNAEKTKIVILDGNNEATTNKSRIYAIQAHFRCFNMVPDTMTPNLNELKSLLEDRELGEPYRELGRGRPSE